MEKGYVMRSCKIKKRVIYQKIKDIAEKKGVPTETLIQALLFCAGQRSDFEIDYCISNFKRLIEKQDEMCIEIKQAIMVTALNGRN